MNSLFLIIGIATVMFLANCEQNVTLVDTALSKLHTTCLKNSEMTEEMFTNSSNAQDPKMNCYLGCVWNATGKFVGGKLQPTKVLHSFRRHMHHTMGIMHANVAKCISKANNETGECNISGVFKSCLEDNIQFHILI
ncbi:uncharacterized protein LOC106638894 [Copidosoma floridanum]|uniref:uncharacterized protein LOC106638894 n=1 Tax=Copidosoma floridanum TaxID=29053 RepID=UPI0006C99AD6|nr:uncharacterized protein LOC106638894 [Copidosoma floridanum]